MENTHVKEKKIAFQREPLLNVRVFPSFFFSIYQLCIYVILYIFLLDIIK